MSFLKNRRALIVGAINDKSIAYGIARAIHREGGELAFTYQSERVKESVAKIASQFGSKLIFPCDVSSDQQIEVLFQMLKKSWEHFDILVHSVAFAPPEQLSGEYIEKIDREAFRIAHDISSYSLAALAKAALPLMQNSEGHGAILTISYIGAIHAIPNYNVMGVAKASLEANVRYLAYNLGKYGIRVNAISAGPLRTVSASGVKNLRQMLSYYEKITPLRKNISLEEVGNAGAFLCSDLSSGITGDILYVDAGFHILGMSIPEKELKKET
jgi:enoyl-[acyl-carrier protein] reductase I